jgi:glycosyltransferase involved in cell wall biosynthesis
MKLLLIKIGKAWNVLKRDGVLRGTKRVMVAFFGLFKRVEPGDILFISNGVGDSARYRTSNVAEELREQGFKASVTVQDNPFLLSYADQFSVFVFHRVLHTEKVGEFVEKLKALNKEIIFETDDLVYDPMFLRHMDYYAKMNAFERELYKNGLGGEILNDPYVTVATTTTSFLAEKLREKGKKVFIVRNKLSKQDLLWGETALKKAKKDPSVIKLCYLSGTISHNKDFATITPVLMELLKKYPKLRLVLAGPLDVENALNEYASQIERVPFVGRKEYFENIATYDINVAPLEVGNPFCESKSELKFFEPGLVAVPTVAAATQTFREAIEDGVDGFVAGTSEEWKEKLEQLITDPSRRVTMGQKARETALNRYVTNNGGETEYYNYLRARIV